MSDSESSGASETQAAHAQVLLAAIVESSDDAILSQSLDGVITSWNAAAERIFGYSSAEILGKNVFLLIPEDLHDEERAVMSRLRIGERIEHYETMRICKSGERIAVSLKVSPVRDGSGEIIGASKMARDIGHQKEMERKLQDSEKVVGAGRMAASIAHEINNPLEAVVNLIYLARINPSVNDQVCEYLKLAEREIERVSLIARQTLGYFRDSARPARVSIPALLEDILTIYSVKLINRGIEVHRDMQDVDLLYVRKSEMTQVLANLLLNAMDAMPNGGDISVMVSEDEQTAEKGVCVGMRDTGTGISADLLDKIFEPFFTTKDQHGTGLGLWLCRQFVEGHHGTIGVTSSTEEHDHGTSFRVFLPYQNGLGPDTAAATIV